MKVKVEGKRFKYLAPFAKIAWFKGSEIYAYERPIVKETDSLFVFAYDEKGYVGVIPDNAIVELEIIDYEEQIKKHQAIITRLLQTKAMLKDALESFAYQKPGLDE